MDVVFELGFDVVDSGFLSDFWRQQSGIFVYCIELIKDEFMKVLKKVNKEKVLLLCDKVMEIFVEKKDVEFLYEDVVNLNREIYNV